MMVRRNLYLAWLALTLNALAPVFAYAHFHVGANGEIVEHCAADEPGESDADAKDRHKDHHSHSGNGTVAHCPYCAGFAAGASLAYDGGLGPVAQGEVSPSPLLLLQAIPRGRSSVRIAQPRAPPSLS